MEENQNFWKKCSACKKLISFGSQYYECSVSTCTGDRTGYVFCNIPCFEFHLPGAKHRSAGAVEKWAPKNLESKRIVISTPVMATVQKNNSSTSSMSHEVLVVVSKMKQYIKDTSEFNTSEDVNMALSNMIRIACDRAIDKAKASGRKTVMARDFSF